ncbi:hypothetical protein CO709_28885 [Burkholderia thailandensis]|nr:hypothetical protein CO709_28885 [Burkholderia thailandensis]
MRFARQSDACAGRDPYRFVTACSPRRAAKAAPAARPDARGPAARAQAAGASGRADDAGPANATACYTKRRPRGPAYTSRCPSTGAGSPRRTGTPHRMRSISCTTC